MAYTLAEASDLMTDPLKKGVIDIFRRESFIMDKLSWEDAGTLSVKVIRTKTLPTVYWRKIGGAWTEGKGQVEEVEERVFDMGGYFDVDKLLVKAKNYITDQRALQTDFYTTALACEFNNQIIVGNPITNEDTLVGLWWRLKNVLPSTQTITNSTGLDISPDAASLSANNDAFLDQLTALTFAIDGHKPDLLLMNDTCYIRLISALRTKGLLNQNQDQYGRMIPTYGPGGPEIWDMGVQADQATRIIGNVELADGTALTGGGSTSIYAARLAEEKYLMGFQEYALDVQDVGLLQTGIAFRTVVDWPIGITHWHPRAIARMVGIIAA
jgi:hypothetical protein